MLYKPVVIGCFDNAATDRPGGLIAIKAERLLLLMQRSMPLLS